jgi:membrane-associated phospholipid phosphatase
MTGKWTTGRLMASVLLIVPTPATADPATWAKASDVVRTGLVAFSIGLPAAKDDWAGVKQDALAMAASEAVTGGLKLAVREDRPDHSNQHSFPSGHTTISFAAAAGLEQRYGWKVGVPAHLAAAFVGLARVEADKHYWHDVIVGAAIGEVAGLVLVDKRQRHGGMPIGAGMTIAF